MKLRIAEGVNSYNGEKMYYVYEVRGSSPEVLHYLFGDYSVEVCRAYIERRKNPPPEKMVEEHEV